MKIYDRLRISIGWTHFCFYTYRLLPLYNGDVISYPLYFIKLGVTPKEWEILEKGQ